MSDTDGGGDRDLPEARSVRSRWPGLVWAIPLAALIIVGYLGVRALTRRGVEVTVTFDYAEGVTPGDTKVLEHGVEVGKVKRVRVSKDAKHVDVTLSLDPRVKAALNTHSMFWLIGENPTLTDIQSIRAAVAGVIIAMAPGTGGTPTRTFQGLGQPPVITPGARGTIYYLEAPKLGSLQPGASVSYRGLPVGKVVSTAAVAYQKFRMEVFINAPYDAYIRPGGQFWTGSPLKLSLSGASVSAGVTSPASLLQGSIDYELPEKDLDRPQAAPGSTFPLYDDQTSAQQGPTGKEVTYHLVLNQAAGDLTPNSDIKMQGYTVGRFLGSQLDFAPGGRPYTDALIVLYPSRLNVVLPADATDAAWRQASDRAVTRLLAIGYRAKLDQSPPVFGSHIISFDDAHAGPGALSYGGKYPTMPVAPAGKDMLAELQRLPIGQIGENVRRLTGNLAAISGSPQIRDSIAHLDGTLTQVDQIMTQVRPQVGPLMAKLNQTADELHGTAAAARSMLSGEGAGQDQSLPAAIGQLDQAARSIRSLTDYLGRHPEALIRGKAKEKK